MSGTATTPAADTPPAPLPNPNTTFQPTVGASSDPTAARVDGLVVTQQHGHDSVSAALVRLGPTLADEDKLELEAAQEILAAGGAQTAIETAADDFEKCLAHLTPTLGADDLSGLNSVLTNMRFLANRLRASDTLGKLDLPEPAPEPEPPPVVPPPEEPPPA